MEFTRDDYLKMRESNNLDLEIIYKYLYKNGLNTDINTFINMFPIYFQFNKDLVLNYFDNKFEIISITDKKGNHIKYY